MMNIKTNLPWWFKISAKIVLSRLPIDHGLWKKLSLFEHGDMQQPGYVYEVFKQHFDRVKPGSNFVSLELGPGESLMSAMVSHAFGGSTSYLVDVCDFSLKDVTIYKEMANFLSCQGLPVPNIHTMNSLENILDSCSAKYLTSGLSSLQSIPSQSVDFIWSQAVLEHIKLAEFPEILRELRRILRPNGACSHLIDLKDHLERRLNNLRFPEWVWESNFMAQSGFYTNRIRYSEMLDLFRKADFDVEIINIKRWSELPTPRAKLAQKFRHLSDDELCVRSLSVVLRPN
jgi:SAM-dependent methyltransferase